MRQHDAEEIAEFIADEIAAMELQLSNQSVEKQRINGAFEGLSIVQMDPVMEADWNEYLDSFLNADPDEIIWDDSVWGEDEIPDEQDVLDRWGDCKVA